jgi:uncharacterized protein (DUF1810 family)
MSNWHGAEEKPLRAVSRSVRPIFAPGGTAMPGTGQNDPYDLQRFLDAQEPVFAEVCAELRAGRKRSHWMWFIFPQLRGLGSSATAEYYAISGLEEAKAYLGHPILGPSLVECCRLVTGVQGLSAQEIFGYPDYLKFRSSMTLFAHAASENQPFQAALEKYFDGKPDPLTMERL